MLRVRGTERCHQMDRANAIFDRIDADRSGEIDSKELMMALLGLGQEHETVSDLFRVLDTDGNGSISREEFIAGFDLYQKEEARLAAHARVASVDWGAPGDARHAWKGKFFTA